jgi:serine/threonine-protein kinase
MSAPDDETVVGVMARARPGDVVERQETLAAVERGLFAKSSRPLAFGRYLLLERLGAGGGGIVHAAYDPELDRKVAIKLVHSAPSRDPDRSEARQRLLREAQAIARLSHPNVLAVFDVGTFSDEREEAVDGVEGPGVYVVMELVDGPDLQRWLDEAKPGWREIVEVFVAAGEGLAAAHAVDVVHRDVKPSNILLGRDGRVRVLDFGLARRATDSSESQRPVESEPEDQESTPSALERRLTQGGTVMGTPAYMAPEQHEALDVDGRADQFGVCVALFEALYGKRPFVGRRLEELAEAKRSGAIQPPPESTRVPAWLHRVMLRGLAPRPEDRFADLPALLAALRADPARRRRKIAARALVVAIVLGLAGVGFAAHRARQAACEGQADELARIWDEPTRAAVKEAFMATEVPYAESSWKAVAGALDSWTADWVEARTETCRQAMIEREQTVAEMGRSVLCLERRLNRVGGLVAVLRTADRALVERAPRLVESLPSLEACQVKTAAPKEAETEEPRKVAILEVERQVARSMALRDGGRYEEAREAATSALAAAKELTDETLQARALSSLGQVAQWESRFAEAERTFRRALVHAERGDDEQVAVDIMLSLAYVVGSKQARPDEGLALLEHAEARQAKLGDEPRRLGRVEYVRGRILEARGDFPEALAAYERALTSYERAFGSEHLLVIDVLNNIGVAHDRMGHYREALAYYERALDARRHQFGDAHPTTANALGNVGATHLNLGRYGEAIAELEQAVATYESAFGPEHRLVAWYGNNLGAALLAVGRNEEALAEHQKVLRIREVVSGSDHPDTLTTRTSLCEVLVELDRPREALVEAETAAAGLESWTDRSAFGHALVARGHVLGHLGRTEEARSDLGRGLSILREALGRDHIDPALALTLLGELALESGDRAAAREWIDAALELHSRNATSDVQRARAWFASARAQEKADPEAAIKLVRRAVAAYDRVGVQNVVRQSAETWLAAHGGGSRGSGRK